MKYFLLKAYDGGSKVISNGSGGKFLADDGTYKTIDVSGSGLTIEQVEAINHVLSDYNNGKVMSAENFTTTLKNKLDSLNGERDLEMRANTTHLQWRYVGDTVWNNIASLDELRGFTVNIGETGQVLTKKSNTSGDWEFRQLDKTDIGLSNVQNVDTTDIDNINESTTKKIMTDAERTKLSNAFVKGTDTTDSLMEGLTKLLLTTAERDKLNNLSGTNTGDQDLSGLVQKTTTINGNPLSSNVEIPLIDTIVSEGTGTSILRTKTGNTQNIKGISGDDSITIVDDVANKNIQVAVNEAGLLYDNIPDGTLYKKVSVGKFDEITHTNRTALDSVSGVNTGDETKTTIEAKLTGNITSHTHSYEPTITAGTTSQYYRGDKTFQTLNKAAVGLSNVTNDAQIKKITSSVNDNIVTFGAATGDTVKDSGKSINNIAFKNEVNTFTKDITINGTLQVSGNIVQNGESYETHSEQVYTKDNTIILRDGAVSGLGAGEYAGFTAKSYDGTNDGQLVFDKDGVARVGDIGSTQAIATREETPSNGNVAIWDSTSSKFITSTGNTGTGSIVRANSPTFTGTVNGITPTMVGLGNVKNLDTSNPANITWAASYRTVTDTEKTAWNGKQNALGYTAENSANKKTAWQATPDNTSYPSEKLVKDNLDLKVDKVTGKQLSTEDYTTTEKTKLSGIAVGANNYVHPTGDGNSHIPATGTTNNGKVLKAGATANSASWGNVDWSEIANKPTTFTPTAHNHAISEVTNLQTSLDAKVNTSDVVTTATANKILKLDENSKLPASITGNADGNAATATKLLTARTINGVSFDGSANITIQKINARGNITCETGTNRPALSGVSAQSCYSNGYPITYGEVLTLDGGGSAQLLLGWAGSKATAPAYIRSKRDVSDSLWSDWHMIYTTAYKPSLTDLGAASSLHAHEFSEITSKPTTLSEYGITDAVNSSNVTVGNSAWKIVQRDGSGDVICRLVRAEYEDQANISGGLVFRTAGGSGTDNYLRVCNNVANIRTFLGVPSTAVATTSANGLMSSTDKTKLDGITAGANNYTHPASGVIAGSYTKVTVDTNGHVTVGASLSASDIPSHDHTSITGNAATATKLQTARTINGISFDGSANITINAVDSTSRIASTEKGAINGVATLDSTGKVPSSQLPSYVDDVLEYTNYAGFPATGETGKIYVDLATNKCYRWSGSAYVYITSGAVDSVNGKTGVVTLSKSDVGLGNVTNLDTSNPANITWSASYRTVTDTEKTTWNGKASTAVATTSAAGLMSSTDKTKLDGIATGANNYVHPASGVIAGTYKSVTVNAQGHITSGTNPTTLSGYGITDATPSSHVGSTGSSHGVASTYVNGFMSSTDKTKLDNLISQYLLYQNTDSKTITSSVSNLASTISSVGVGRGGYTAAAGKRIRIECVFALSAGTSTQIMAITPTINGTVLVSSPSSPTVSSGSRVFPFVFDIIFTSNSSLTCISEGDGACIVTNSTLGSGSYTGDIDLKLDYYVGGSTTGSITIHHLNITYLG